MRLLELGLRAYGPFTDVTLDLSGGDQGLHLVYGANEAGKSSALRALRALFYGIGGQTTDAFLHDYGSLRIGARIRDARGRELAFVRRKGSKNTILDPSEERPHPDEVLDSFLGGADENAFDRIWGIGHDELLKGGEELQAMRGLAGESLFTAGIGGASLSEVLAALDDEAKALRPGRGGTLYSLLREYREACDERKAAARPVRDWDALAGELAEVTTQRQNASERLEKLRVEQSRTERLGRALGLVRERRSIAEAFERLGDVRVLPPTYSADARRDAWSKLGSLRPVVDRLRRKLDGDGGAGGVAGLRARIASITVPEDLLRQAEVVSAVRDRLGAHLKAMDDISKLRERRDGLRASATAILGELRPGSSWEDVDGLRLAPDRKVRIQDLAGEERRSREEPGKLAAHEADIGVDLAARRNEIDGLGAPVDAEPLARALRLVRKRGDLDEQLARARAELRRASDEARGAVARLGLFRGTLEEAERLPVPSGETVERFVERFARLDDEERRLGEKETENEERAEHAARDIMALRKEGDVPSEEALATARGRRDVGWGLVRAAWLDARDDPEAVRAFAGEMPLMDAYEASVRDADDVSDRLWHEAGRVAELAGLRAVEEEAQKKRAVLAGDREAIAKKREEAAREWREAWTPAGIPEPLPPAEMRTWLARHEAIVGMARDVREKTLRVEDAERSVTSARAELSEPLAALGEPAAAVDESLAALLERGEDVMARFENTTRRRRDLEKEIRSLETERTKTAERRKKAEEDLEKWRARWADAVSAIGCGPDATGAEVNARIARIDELFGKVGPIADLEHRIESMQADARELERMVIGLVESIAKDLRELARRAPEQAAAELVARLEKAREYERALADLRAKEEETAAELAETERQLAETLQRLEELCRLAGVERPEELEEAERLSQEVSRLRERSTAIEGELRDAAAGEPVDEFVAGAVDPDTLAARTAKLVDDIRAVEEERKQLDLRTGEIRKGMEAFDGSGAAAEADEKAMGLMGRIRGAAERFIRLRVAAAFLKRQIERHRAATEDPILARASDVFATLTCGAFERLKTQYGDDDQAVVVGVRPGGEHVLTVDQMSDGTRDQLYLALRLAYLERQIESREPLPLVVDDILVNFDDERAAATLRVLGELSGRTQVLFFTHHTRLVTLAETVVPPEALFVHELPEPRAAG